MVLPTVFVFASNVGLLQALELDSDEKDVLADVHSRSNDAAVVSEEARNIQTFFQSLFRRSAAVPKTSTMSAAQAAKVVQSTKSVSREKIALDEKEQWTRSFGTTVEQWRTSGKPFNNFVDSSEYQLICKNMLETNRFLSSKDAFRPSELFVEKLSRKELNQVVAGARHSNNPKTKVYGEMLDELLAKKKE